MKPLNVFGLAFPVTQNNQACFVTTFPNVFGLAFLVTPNDWDCSTGTNVTLVLQ